MSERFVPTGPHDRRLALRAPAGLLRDHNRAGVLQAADVHVAVRLGRLGQEPDERVLLAAALAVRAVQDGSVCVDLRTVAEDHPPTDAADPTDPTGPTGSTGPADPAGQPEPDPLTWPEPEPWLAAVAASPLVAAGVLHVEDGLVYLDRYHAQEVQVADDLAARAAQPAPAVDEAVLGAGAERVFPGPAYAEQRAAALEVARRWTTVLTGGPGTGKTTTVAGVLALLAEQTERAGRSGGAGAGGVAGLRIALAAPTGKAAARLQEAVAEATARLPEPDRARLPLLRATTVHRLLGWRADSRTRFRHDRSNRLPHDVVVVDEASMLSLTLMARVLEAVRPEARLLVVGDPDQLASVEAGAVLADLVAGRPGDVAALRTTHRFGAGIGALAQALRDGDADAVVAVLRDAPEGVRWLETDEPRAALHDRLLDHARAVRAAATAGRVDGPGGALDLLGRHRLLCAHREGPYGVQTWNRLVEQWLGDDEQVPLPSPSYAGRPLLVTRNDATLGLANGDVGVVVRAGEGLRAVLAASPAPVDLAVSRLADVETMHAMTIHKSQGSQADEVTVLLPEPGSRLLTRELLYTAVTRAQERVVLVGTEAGVRAAVERQVRRASGLRRRLGG